MVSLIRLIPLKRNLYHFLLTICWLWVVGPISQEILVVITNTFYAIFHPILTSTPNFLKFGLETQFFYYFQISIITKTFFFVSFIQGCFSPEQYFNFCTFSYNSRRENKLMKVITIFKAPCG